MADPVKLDLEKHKENIERLGLQAISEMFNIKREDMENLPKHILNFIHKKAQLGMQFEKEFNLTNRAIERNYLYSFRLVAEDKKELRQLIKKSLPHYLPS